MIKSTELRIGNLVNWNGEVAIVSQLWERDIFFKCGENDLYDAIKPIPLSKEWFNKFGFVENCLDEDNKWLNLKYRFLNFSSDESVRFKKVYLSVNKMDIICDYVHQLQNVFFFLTGQELIKKNQEK